MLSECTEQEWIADCRYILFARGVAKVLLDLSTVLDLPWCLAVCTLGQQLAGG